ncbi:MAG: transcriptional regulator, Fis family [Verrucomicrobiales bacterium]|nr:transcriptional regulator, Fis family [Verrucomicrobiales bacterium]
MKIVSRLTLLSLAFLTSCAVGPNYKAGDPADTAGSFVTPGADASATGDITDWWEKFREPKLNNLIRQALVANQDLKIAVSRVAEARATRTIARADYFPQLNAGANATRSKSSEAAAGLPGLGGQTTNLFNLNLDASWEIDVFGGTRRNVEAATADLQAAGENARDVQVGLIGEVATAYLELRGYQARKSVAERNLKSQRDTLELTRTRQAVGVSNDLDVARAEAQMEATAAAIPVYEASLRRSIYRLGVLLGGSPGSLVDNLISYRGQPVAPPAVPVGLPSDLLRRRPDIRRSERELAAATARIGVAVADLYPKFSLTAGVGRSALETQELFNGRAGSWSLGPSLNWPIFTAGKIRGNIAVQNARQEQAAATYEKTVYLAMEDVEGSLISFGQEQKRYASLTRAVGATRRASSLANDRYKAGLEDFLTVLEADRQLLSAEDSQVSSQTQVSLNLVRLYKALGGGWGEARVKK